MVPSRATIVGCLGILLLFCGRAAAQAPLVALQSSAPELYLGDRLVLSLQLDGAGENADVYVALLLPDGGFLTYGSPNQPAAPGEIVPLATGVALAPATLVALDQPLAVPILEGAYFAVAALAPSGVSIFESQLAISAPLSFRFTIDRPVLARGGLWRGGFEGMEDAALEFRVAADGSEIESGARATQLEVTCSSGCGAILTETVLAAALPITELSFSISDPVFGSFAGQFDSALSASGSYTLSGDLGSPCGICTVGELSWTAAWIEP